MNPNTQLPQDPQQQFPSQPSPVVSVSQSEQTPVQQPPEVPPKKSRRGLIIGLSIGLAVLIVAVIVTVIGFSFKSQADDAARQYDNAVLAHVDQILTAETPKERAELFETKPELKEAPFGDVLSDEYKNAQTLKARYDAMVDEARPVVQERYATLELSPFIKRVVAQLDASISTSMPEIKDEATKQTAQQTIASLRDKGESYMKLGDEFLTFQYDEKYKEAQKGYSDTLKEMGKTWTQLAEVQQRVFDKQVEILNTSDEIKKAELTVNLLTITLNAQTEMETLTANYKGKELTPAMNALVLPIVKDEYIQTIAKKVQEVQQNFTNFRAELEAN